MSLPPRLRLFIFVDRFLKIFSYWLFIKKKTNTIIIIRKRWFVIICRINRKPIQFQSSFSKKIFLFPLIKNPNRLYVCVCVRILFSSISITDCYDLDMKLSKKTLYRTAEFRFARNQYIRKQILQKYVNNTLSVFCCCCFQASCFEKSSTQKRI